EELAEQRSAKPIPLHGHNAVQDAAEPPPIPISNPTVDEANRCVESLRRNPNDLPAREKLARLFAEQLQEPERGLEQLIMLLELPGQLPNKRAEWFSLAARWHTDYRRDQQAAIQTWQRLLRECPFSPQAAQARAHLATHMRASQRL